LSGHDLKPKATSLLADVTAGDKIECARSTFDDYVAALEMQTRKQGD